MVAAFVALALCASLSFAPVYAEQRGEAGDDGVDLVQVSVLPNDEAVPSAEGELLGKSDEENLKPARSHHAKSKKRTKQSKKSTKHTSKEDRFVDRYERIHKKKRRASKGKKTLHHSTKKRHSPKAGAKIKKMKAQISADEALAATAFKEDLKHHHPVGHHGRHRKLPESSDRLYSCCDDVEGEYAKYWKSYLTSSTGTSGTIKPYCTESFYGDTCDCVKQGYPIGSDACIPSDRTALCSVCKMCYSEGCPHLKNTQKMISSTVSESVQAGGTLKVLSCCDRGSVTTGSDKLWRDWLTRPDPSNGDDRANYCSDSWYTDNCLVSEIDPDVKNICHVCTTCFDEGCARWEEDQVRIVDVRGPNHQ